jgi:hypothetical protein
MATEGASRKMERKKEEGLYDEESVGSTVGYNNLLRIHPGSESAESAQSIEKTHHWGERGVRSRSSKGDTHLRFRYRSKNDFRAGAI